MVTHSTYILGTVVALYLLAFAFYLRQFAQGKTGILKPAYFIEGGFLIHTLDIFVHASSVNPTAHGWVLPVGSVGEASAFFAWSLAFVYLILAPRLKVESFGVVLAPFLVLFLVPSFFPFKPHSIPEAYLHDAYFLLHILSAFFAYASFTLAFIAGILYLLQDRALKKKTSSRFLEQLPSLENLERLEIGTILWGLVLLGAAIVIGSLWSHSVFGSYLLIEPKSLATILTWCFYLAIVYANKVSHVKGKRLIRLSIGAFVLVLFTFLGTSVFQQGLHIGIW